MSEDMKIPTMLTIKETAKRTGLAEYYIRQLVLKNEISSFRAGNKYLVYYENLLAYLNEKQRESLSI